MSNPPVQTRGEDDSSWAVPVTIVGGVVFVVLVTIPHCRKYYVGSA